jgi:hypothetical protein
LDENTRDSLEALVLAIHATDLADEGNLTGALEHLEKALALALKHGVDEAVGSIRAAMARIKAQMN